MSPTTVATLVEYIQEVLRITTEWRSAERRGPEIWFRGHYKETFELRPGAFRQPGTDFGNMFLTFQCDARPLLPDLPSSVWEWYFAAQHYGLPTTLLDWTDDPLAALYFAVRDVHPEHRPLPVDPDRGTPHVWLMDAAELNEKFHSFYEVVVPDDPTTAPLSSYWLAPAVGTLETFPYEGGSKSNELPLAVYPVRRTRRIVAQRGCFTAHGSARATLDEQAKTRVTRLKKIELSDPDAIGRDLFALGIDRYRYFPEPHVLTEHIIRRCTPSC